MPADLSDDDALADALADAWVEAAASDPALCRLALRAAGLRPEPAEMTVAQLAAEHGIDRRRIPEIEAAALAKLHRHLRALLDS